MPCIRLHLLLGRVGCLPHRRSNGADPPDDWLTHQKSIADFCNALNAGDLSAVGLDSVEPGLVLYTLKSGEKGSTLVPGVLDAWLCWDRAGFARR